LVVVGPPIPGKHAFQTTLVGKQRDIVVA
jgi:hypothetical protein